MKSNIITGLILLFCMQFMLTSCEKWLDVKPEDKTLEEDIFKHEININKALNAIYNNLTASDLYGQQLTKSTVDVMAQYYNTASKTVSGTNRYVEVLNFNYKASENQSYYNRVWSKGYETILSINNFLEGLEKYNVPLSPDNFAILKGESLGLRALMHFDLLRLFGPVMSTDPQAASIVYKTDTDVGLKLLQPADQVIQLIIKDLETAAELLKADPVIHTGKQVTVTSTGDNFYMNRNKRMNYYAILALQARVYLYSGNKVEAAKAAQKVIDEGSVWFGWQGEQDHLGLDGDRIFSNEVIFGLEDLNMYTSQKDLFDGSLTNDFLLAPLRSPNVAQDIYENNAQDFRFIANFEDLSASQASTRPYAKLFIKYKDVDTKNKDWRNLQPLFRISEMYYILAECREDAGYLNIMRSHRGLEPLGPNVNLESEILKAYRKEFMGEGQLFFYYKRTNQPTIKGYNLSNIPMDKTKYVVPLPLSETNQR